MDFIEHLNVFSQSKGRTPTVFVFNPLAEARMAGGKGFSPTKHQAQLVRDLTNLPQFLCRQDDIVLVERKPSVHFLSRLKEAGFVLPEFVEFDWSAGLRTGASPPKLPKHTDLEIGAPGDQPNSLAQRKLGGLRPWAWGPDSLALFKPLFDNVTVKHPPADQCFNDGIAALYSKAWSADFLRRLLSSHGPAAWLCSESEVGVVANSVAAAREAIAAIRARGHHRIVLKESLGLAGSNALRLFEPELRENQLRWMANVLTTGQQIVVEPWLERELDFSVQLEMTSAGLKLCGYTGLLNDHKGQFLGNLAEPKHERKLPAAVPGLLNVLPVVGNQLQTFFGEIFAALELELRRVSLLGAIGIDAFVYRTANGARRLKPIVEINPRHTMGRVTVELMQRAAQGSFGLFRLINRAQLRVEGAENFVAFDRMLHEKFPLRFAADPSRRISEGAICLNDPTQAQVCLAVFQMFRSAAEPHHWAGLSPGALVNNLR